MNNAPLSPVPLANPYVLRSVLPVPPPSGAEGARWHRYEIGQGGNTIVGYLQGGADSVLLAAETMVVRLNERRLHARGRVQLALGSRAQ